MWGKVTIQFFIAIAVVFSMMSIAYNAIPEVEQVPVVFIQGEPNTFEIGQASNRAFTGWVTGAPLVQGRSVHESYNPYYGRGYDYDRYDDRYNDGDRGYLFRSGDCKSYYTDEFHPLYGECRDFTDIDENPHQIRRCDKFCSFDFNEKFDLCEANYADGTRELGQCVDHYISKENNYDSICFNECVV